MQEIRVSLQETTPIMAASSVIIVKDAILDTTSRATKKFSSANLQAKTAGVNLVSWAADNEVAFKSFCQELVKVLQECLLAGAGLVLPKGQDCGQLLMRHPEHEITVGHS